MRFALLPAALLAACAMSAGAAQAGLNCPQPGDALTARLCAALRQELDQSGTPAPPLTLQAHSPRPDLLRARLSIGKGAARRDGPELELTVMDRADIPDRQLSQLARLLLDRTLPPDE
ncbi:hypothetical protein [Paracoccus sp. DMF]|uniref:hypothetical protein n=1 Tax=Paracoccus sp. DMF TaxID=400837 RepID=UPI0021E515BC|nr:hypothetical protein [Paracoccus sp. DMF]MCV2446814.1 hypothetical protein [Paracoccus sp. DMF]